MPLAKYLLDAIDGPARSPTPRARGARPVPLDGALYRAVQREARARFAVYPSAYANAWIVRTYKARGGRYAGPRAAGGLTKWFAQEWIDLARPRPDGTYAPCGRAHATPGKGYPKCVPRAVAEELSERERRSAVRRKRRAELDAAPGPRAPVRVRTRAR